MVMMLKRLEAALLRWLQRRCRHPSNMVAVDILEGCADGIRVKYCRHCGSVDVEWSTRRIWPEIHRDEHKTWRHPEPNLWRG